MLRDKSDNREIVQAIFLSGLAREATDAELNRLLKVVAEYETDERKTALQDVAWSVLTSTEFTFNH